MILDFFRPRRQHKTNTIVQFWDNGAPPKLLSERMAQWKSKNPSWKYELYCTESAASCLEKLYSSELAEGFLAIRMPAMKADVFRVGWLLAHGGLWVDAATVCGAPLQSWLNRDNPVVLLSRPGMTPPRCWNGVIYVRDINEPFLIALWERISHSILNREGTSVWEQTGPGLFGDVLTNNDFTDTTTFIPLQDLEGKVEYGSSSHFLPVAEHWSKRQVTEPLYL